MFDFLPLIYSLGFAIIFALVSFLGILLFRFNWLKNNVKYLVSLAAGAMLADAFVHILPEAIEKNGGFGLELSLTFLLSILVGFLMESYLRWQECCDLELQNLTDSENTPKSISIHNLAKSNNSENKTLTLGVPNLKEKTENTFLKSTNQNSKPNLANSEVLKNGKLKTLGFMNLFGDSWCNFNDGITLSVAFLASPLAGMATGLAILLHEIPQEIADFGVLIHSGFDQKQAKIANFLISLISILGVLFGYFVVSNFPFLQSYFLTFGAGSVSYLALASLIPEVHKNHQKGFDWKSFTSLLLGIILITLIKLVE